MASSPEVYEVGVKAVIIRDGRLLMLRRIDHNNWDMPGGRVDHDESTHTALLREIAEELPGTSIVKIGKVVHAEQSNFRLPNGRRLLLVFYEVEVDISEVVTYSSEHGECIWADLQMLDSCIMPNTIAGAAYASLKNL